MTKLGLPTGLLFPREEFTAQRDPDSPPDFNHRPSDETLTSLRSFRKRSLSARFQEVKIEQNRQAEQSLRSLDLLPILLPKASPEKLNTILKALALGIQAGKKLRDAFQGLATKDREFLQENLGEDKLRNLFSIAENVDPKIFWEEILHWGISLKLDRDWESAGALLSWMATQAPADLLLRAQAEYGAVVGQGSEGLRSEVLLAKLSQDATDYRTVVPMLASGMVFDVIRTASLARLATPTVKGWLKSPLAARVIAGMFGFASEVATFSLSNRVLQQWSGENIAWDTDSVGKDLLSSTLSLGALKIFGLLGNRAFLKLHGMGELGVATQLQGWTKLSQVLIPQTAMFGGMLASHSLEIHWGLRKKVDDATLVTDTLSSMLSMGVGGHLGHQVLGAGMARFTREIELRADAMRQNGGGAPVKRDARDSYRQAMALINNPMMAVFWMAMGVGGGGGGGGGGGKFREAFPIRLDFQISEKPSEAEIGKVVKAIVAQDKELYPEGDARVMTGDDKYMDDRWYRVGNEDLNLKTLVRRLRQARGLRALDQTLKVSQILEEWKRDLWGIVKESRASLPIHLDFTPSKNPSEEEIRKILKAMVAQDQAHFPEGDASLLSSHSRFRDHWYRVGDEEFNLETLVRRLRQARGIKANDSKALGFATILKEWKRDIWGIETEPPQRDIKAIVLDFTPSQKMTEAEIGEIVKAIVAQDTELYPEGNASHMSANHRLFRDQWYRVGEEELTLLTLAGRVRQARGFKADDFKALSGASLVMEWKRDLWGLDVDVPIKDIQAIALDFSPSEEMTKTEIEKIVEAIVSQDTQLFPDGDLRRLSRALPFRERRYKIGDEVFTFTQLQDRYRQAHLRQDPTMTLNNEQVIGEWKRVLCHKESGLRIKKLIPIVLDENSSEKKDEVENFLDKKPTKKKDEVEKALDVKPTETMTEVEIALDLKPSETMTETEIGQIVKAIVAQDHEFYPDGDPSLISTSEDKPYMKRAYKVGNENLSLKILVGRVREARGLQSNDFLTLASPEILKEWRRELWGMETHQDAKAITLDFTPSYRLTEREIEAIVKAIVEQDQEFYPGGDANRLSGSNDYFARYYRIGGRDLNLRILVSQFRVARGMKAGDLQTLSNRNVLEGWKRNIWGIGLGDSGAIPIQLDFIPSSEMTEEEIGRVVKAIVLQDREFYPEGDGSRMSGTDKVMDRKYKVGDGEFTLSKLAGRVRKARGFKAADIKSLSDGKILKEWKQDFWQIEEEVRVREVKDIQINFIPSKPMTEIEILAIVKAIVEQDQESYPDGDGGGIVRSKRLFDDRQYRIAGEEINLGILAWRVRRARGLKGTDRSLGDAQIVQEWKQELWGIEKETSQSVFPLQLNFTPSKTMTEEEIGSIVKAIVSQDSDFYPNADGSLLTTATHNYYRRYYLVAGEALNLNMLASRLRQARGLKPKDFKALGHGQIIEEWKRELFNSGSFQKASPEALQAFIRQADLQPLLDLFSQDPAQLVEALSFLKAKEFEHKDVVEFVKAYIGLQVKTAGGGRALIELNAQEKRLGYLAAVMRALEKGESIYLSEENYQKQLNLLIRLSRKSFEESPQKYIDALRLEAEKSSHSFLKRLQREAADYFQGVRDFKVGDMVTEPFGYQREGIHFLTTHSHAILADEAGMGKSYQAIAAIENLGLKRVLWVTTAANRETLREEILTHSQASDHDVKIVISRKPGERTRQIQALNGERYVLTNYETLVGLQKKDPSSFAKLTQGLDLLIVDEAQMADNPETLRTKALHDIFSPRRWLLSATPYQNKPEKMWTLLNWMHPKQYPDFAAFKKIYAENTQGLNLLHGELRNLMLRRTKQETLSYFEDPGKLSFADQLKGGIPRLAKKLRRASEAASFSLSEEQADLIAWMTADFKGWVEYRNAHLFEGAEAIALEKVNPMMKFATIHRVIYSPDSLGITTPNPIFKALDSLVGQSLEQGKKVILWAWNTKVLDALERDYRPLGVRRIDGRIVGEAREQARRDFQELPEVKIMVANYLSGGVGLTLSAADSAIFVQLPYQYPLLYQAEGRHQRLIGLKNARHAKKEVDVEWMIPHFPPGFVEGLRDPRLSEILSHGTLVEQTRARLEGGEILYNLLMEGYGDLEELEKYFKAGLIQGMGLRQGEKLDYLSHVKGETKILAQVAGHFLPLWKLVQGDPRSEENVLHLIELLKATPERARVFGEALAQLARPQPKDLEFLTGLFTLKNKYIREQMLNKVPRVLLKAYSEGKSLNEMVEQLGVGEINPMNFLARSYLQFEVGSEAILGIVRALREERNNALKQYWEERFLVGVFGAMGNDEAEALLRNKEALFHETIPVTERIHALYRIGLLARTRKDFLRYLDQSSYDDWQGFSRELETATWRAVAEFAGREPEQIEAMLHSNPHWRGDADPLLALLAAYQEGDDDELLAQYREVLGPMLEGELNSWRKEEGRGVDFLPEARGFWESFGQNSLTKYPEVRIDSRQANHLLVKGYISLREEVNQSGAAAEGPWVRDEFSSYQRGGEREKLNRQQGLQRELRALGSILGTKTSNAEDEEVLERLGIKLGDEISDKTQALNKVQERRNLQQWIHLEEGFRKLSRREPVDLNGLIHDLQLKTKHYRSRSYDKVAEHFEELANHLKDFRAGALQFKDVTIEDTDDPAILTRMGALHPELVNCFNPNGNPVFNQYVVTALGSKNMKMLLVKAEGKIVAAAMVKVKRLEDETPVLFLENGIYRKGYDFRKEMLEHLFKKAEGMDPQPKVMDEVPGRRPKEGDLLVFGTGAYTGSEYVESVFGIRDTKYVKHHGRLFEMKAQEPQDSPAIALSDQVSVSGIGTSNRKWEDYVSLLKERGVKILVDVRANPHSQYSPQFNRRTMEVGLKREGIEYVWLGETLGNPKDPRGERSLEGFQRYMQTPKYQEGIRQLKQLLQQTEGHVALTCSEGKECDCHRQWILADLGALSKNE